MSLTAATCFSGIGAPELGGPQFAWQWAAEFAAGPANILRQRFDHPNLGDVTADDFIDRAKAFGPLDLLVGGPPCQAFSFAGLRQSLSDDRGNLSLRFVEIAHAIRPRNLLVENVPGWLSTDDNAFGCFLGAIVGGDAPLLPCEPSRGGPRGKCWRELDDGTLVPKWPDSGMVAGPLGRAAWRVLDAQYFGLAQRRNRVFVVVDFGAGADPARILFERRGLRGNSPPRRDARQDVAGTLSARSQGGGGLGTDLDLAGGLVPAVCPTLRAGGNATGGDRPPGTDVDTAESLIPVLAHTLSAEGFDDSEDGTGRGTPLVPIAFGATMSATQEFSESDVAPALKDGSKNPTAVAFQTRIARNGRGYGEDVFPALTGADAGETSDMRNCIAREVPEVVGAICKDSFSGGMGNKPEGAAVGHVLATRYAVRRLTPVECERLQGFPDGFTLVEGKSWRKVSPEMAAYLRAQGGTVVEEADGTLRTRAVADGPRYKALGNSWAVDCGRWILARLAEALSE